MNQNMWDERKVSNQTISFQDLTVGSSVGLEEGSGVGSFVTSQGVGGGVEIWGNGKGSIVVGMSLGLGVGLIDEGTKFWVSYCRLQTSN